VTPASFEPTIDYVVTKIPRFTFEKFPGAVPLLNTSMKSVGEAMAIGRSFPESLQKALRSMETGLGGLDEIAISGTEQPASVGSGAVRDAVTAALARPTPDRLLIAGQALRLGFSTADIHAATRYDPWFIEQLRLIVDAESAVRRDGLPDDADGLRDLKRLGFSDTRLAALAGSTEGEVAALRDRLGVRPAFKRVDTCAAEFESRTPYMYSTYEPDTWATADGDIAVECEAQPSDRSKVIVLGGGPNRIGQGIEFDYCCCHAAYALGEAGHETIMVNCNPETVSTDYDTSDRLYFEPLTVEDVLEIIRVERARGTLRGVIVQFGGQTPLKLSQGLGAAGVPILGTSPDAIDLAEDRERFQQLLRRLDLRQPENGLATSSDEAAAIAARIGYPVLIRPSYVLGGRAMEIVHDQASLERYMREAVKVSGDSPVLIDDYLSDAIEVDVDALCDGHDVVVAGIMEHIEEAGVHSGDSACVLPPQTLSAAIVDDIRQQTEVLARALGVVGLMNVQYAVKDGTVYILEVNPRASRTVPFVAKATGQPVAKFAARIMAGDRIAELPFDRSAVGDGHVAVKEAVFPFSRFPGVDVMLGPEMRSTGEVMGLDVSFARAFAKSQIASGTMLPLSGTVFVSVKDGDKPGLVAPARTLVDLGFALVATRGTAAFLNGAGVPCAVVNKVLEGSPHIVDAIKNGTIALVFNTTEGAKAIADSFSLRRAALTERVPYYTTLAGIRAAVQAIETLAATTGSGPNLDVVPLQSYSRLPM
jgi:carbamoyl-phosphate synthase large subunit